MLSIFRKKAKENRPPIILGMVMLQDADSFDVVLFMDNLKLHSSQAIRDSSGGNDVLTFSVDGELVAISVVPVPIPKGDIEGTAQYAYNWMSALEDVACHQAHLIVTVMHGSATSVKRYRVFTAVVASLLQTTAAIGVYMGSQSLLIPTDDYLAEAERMSDDQYPLNLWIYFGLRTSGGKGSGYTDGLKQFNKLEMEVVDSDKSLDDIRGFLYNMSHYVLEYDVVFKHGQTCGMSETERCPITISKGVYLDQETIRIGY
jgi:Domain of unknown function (DUF4261)